MSTFERVTNREYKNGFGDIVTSIYRHYYVSTGPHVVPHNFEMTMYDCGFYDSGAYYDHTWHTNEGHQPPCYSLTGPPRWSSADTALDTNKAYGKFADKYKDSAQNANNLLEFNQSTASILKHAKSLRDAVRAAERFDLPGLGKALGVTVSGSKKQRIIKRAKQPADLWLEYHFGWEPLVQDIGNSINVMQGVGKSGSSAGQTVHAHASSSGGYYEDLKGRVGISIRYYDSGQDSVNWQTSTSMRAKVKVSSPNVAIANQMGFVNPASVAWEAVPFSFVVDWFANVGQCLSAMTDEFGFQITNAWTTRRILQNRTFQYQLYDRANPEHELENEERYQAKYFSHSRAQGIAGPTLQVSNPLKGLGLQRGATAISLLVQQLSNLNKR
jgi:hypothetical protein